LKLIAVQAVSIYQDRGNSDFRSKIGEF